MHYLPILILLFISSCSSTKKNQELAWEEWKGHSTSELAHHPYFKNIKLTKIKHEEGSETWLFKDQTPVQTGAYCESLGGCIGLPIINCSSAFSIKDDRIEGLQQSGTCPPIKLIAPEKK
jgi:hypothetical protein